jgi:pilus assembly protein CpaF
VTESLIERVRERLAADAGRGALQAGSVARAIRAESAGLLGDTEMLSNLRAVQTELTGAGVLEPLLCGKVSNVVLVNSS